MALNSVIAGDYKKYNVLYQGGSVYLSEFNSWNPKTIYLDKDTVREYNVVNENYKKTVGGVVGRAAVGAAILGPIGLLAGATAKNKGTYVVAITFRDGKQSLLEIDEKRYKALVTSCF